MTDYGYFFFRCAFGSLLVSVVSKSEIFDGRGYRIAVLAIIAIGFVAGSFSR
jgi:hypothetical protein